jgi:cytochrome c oxidase subunit 3/cytochrome c oxidase subunit I+III
MADLVAVRPDAHAIELGLKRSSGWWGMIFVIATEAAVFAYLLFSYYYMAIEIHSTWPSTPPSLKLALPNTIILLASSIAIWWGERQFARARRAEALIGVSLAGVLGLVFSAVQLLEWHNKTFTIASDPYGALYFTITGFHMAHVVAGLLIIAALLAWMAGGLLSDRRRVALSIGALYWHFVDAVWLTVFFTFYITPYLS